MALYNESSRLNRDFMETLVAMCQDADTLLRTDSTICIRSPIELLVCRSTSIAEQSDRIHLFAADSTVVLLGSKKAKLAAPWI